MTDKTLAERVADEFSARARDIECTWAEEKRWKALAEFVLAADVTRTACIYGCNRYDAALAALAKALGVEP